MSKSAKNIDNDNEDNELLKQNTFIEKYYKRDASELFRLMYDDPVTIRSSILQHFFKTWKDVGMLNKNFTDLVFPSKETTSLFGSSFYAKFGNHFAYDVCKVTVAENNNSRDLADMKKIDAFADFCAEHCPENFYRTLCVFVAKYAVVVVQKIPFVVDKEQNHYIRISECDDDTSLETFIEVDNTYPGRNKGILRSAIIQVVCAILSLYNKTERTLESLRLFNVKLSRTSLHSISYKVIPSAKSIDVVTDGVVARIVVDEKESKNRSHSLYNPLSAILFFFSRLNEATKELSTIFPVSFLNNVQRYSSDFSDTRLKRVCKEFKSIISGSIADSKNNNNTFPEITSLINKHGTSFGCYCFDIKSSLYRDDESVIHLAMSRYAIFKFDVNFRGRNEEETISLPLSETRSYIVIHGVYRRITQKKITFFFKEQERETILFFVNLYCLLFVVKNKYPNTICMYSADTFYNTYNDLKPLFAITKKINKECIKKDIGSLSRYIP